MADRLANCFGKSANELTVSQRALVERQLEPGQWDGMKPDDRRAAAEEWDLKNLPASDADSRSVEKHFDDLGAAEADMAYWNSRSDISASDAAIRQDRLKPILKRLGELGVRHKGLRGDCLPLEATQAPAVHRGAAPNDWKSKIQIKATEHWKSLRNSGANPTVRSISAFMATWCRENDIRTSGGINPSERYIQVHVLGGRHWSPPR